MKTHTKETFMRKILFSALIVLIFTFSAFAQNKDVVNGTDTALKIEKFRKALDLNDAQVEKISVIMRNSTEEINKKKIDVQRNALDLKEELIKDKPDLNKIKTFVDKKASLQADTEMFLIKRDLDIKAVLTPDQLANWKKIVRLNNLKSDKKDAVMKDKKKDKSDKNSKKNKKNKD